jgi:hypothetical protein
MLYEKATMRKRVFSHLITYIIPLVIVFAAVPYVGLKSAPDNAIPNEPISRISL